MNRLKDVTDTCFKIDENDLKVEFQTLSPNFIKRGTFSDDRIHEIKKQVLDIEELIRNNDNEVAKLNSEIEKLTNHADGIDYMIAVTSGILAGVIDSVFVGEFSTNNGNWKKARAFSNKSVNKIVMSAAKKAGYKGKRLDGAIKFLEDHYKLASDNVSANKYSHHLDDFAHHPTPIGLLCSILMQFTETSFFAFQDGTVCMEALPCAITKDGTLIGKDFITKIIFGTFNWAMHLISDMSGSNKTAGHGMGIPGPFLSMLKEMSALPIFRDSALPKAINDAFVKAHFDLRGEIAATMMQSVPVLINEAMVRGLYLVYHLYLEFKEKKELANVEWSKVLPWGNRTIVRMLTIATATFTVIDLADAGIRSFIKAKGINPAFFTHFILQVNFVGIGRLAIACYTDATMGLKKYKLEKIQSGIYTQQIVLKTAKLYYLQANNWIAIEETGKTISEVYKIMYGTIALYNQSLIDIQNQLNCMAGIAKGIDEHNPGLRKEVIELLN